MATRQRAAQVQNRCRLLELNVNTFGGNLKLATLGDLDSFDGLVSSGSLGVLNLLDNFVALEDLTEDNVSAIEPPGDVC